MKAKGFDPGPIDGIMGPKTTSALKDFQKKEGLQMTGRLNAEKRAPLEVFGHHIIIQPGPFVQ